MLCGCPSASRHSQPWSLLQPATLPQLLRRFLFGLDFCAFHKISKIVELCNRIWSGQDEKTQELNVAKVGAAHPQSDSNLPAGLPLP